MTHAPESGAARRRVLLAWSSGKDSAWSLHELRSDPSVEVVGLLATIDAPSERMAMHAVRVELVRAQARAARLPLWEAPIPSPCSAEDYAAAMRRVLARAHAESVTHMAFGDLFLEDVRRYREERLAGTGIEPLFPLWGRPTPELARTMMEGGLRAVLTCVDPARLDASWIGRDFDARLLAELPPGADPCGEHGEFHTFCHAGPMFDTPIPFERGARVRKEGLEFVDLVASRTRESKAECAT